MSGEIDFSKCKRLYIRGANKAGVWSVVSTDLKQCHVVDSHSQIRARIVIDALGTAGIYIFYGFIGKQTLNLLKGQKQWETSMTNGCNLETWKNE